MDEKNLYCPKAFFSGIYEAMQNEVQSLLSVSNAT